MRILHLILRLRACGNLRVGTLLRKLEWLDMSATIGLVVAFLFMPVFGII